MTREEHQALLKLILATLGYILLKQTKRRKHLRNCTKTMCQESKTSMLMRIK